MTLFAYNFIKKLTSQLKEGVKLCRGRVSPIRRPAIKIDLFSKMVKISECPDFLRFYDLRKEDDFM